MSGVRIVVDSTADLPHNLAEELDITVVPANVHFGDQTYLDNAVQGAAMSGPPAGWAVVHANCLDKARELATAIDESLGQDGGPICDLRTVVGTHVGPGTVGIAVCRG